MRKPLFLAVIATDDEAGLIFMGDYKLDELRIGVPRTGDKVMAFSRAAVGSDYIPFRTEGRISFADAESVVVDFNDYGTRRYGKKFNQSEEFFFEVIIIRD